MILVIITWNVETYIMHSNVTPEPETIVQMPNT